MLSRLVLAFGLTAALLGATVLPAQRAAGETPTIQESYTGDCRQRPAGTACLEYADGYVWLVRDTITGWGSNHGTIQIAYGLSADYAHALGTNMVWTLPK